MKPSLVLFSGPPGPPPRPNLVWHEDTHRWALPDGHTHDEIPLARPDIESTRRSVVGKTHEESAKVRQLGHAIWDRVKGVMANATPAMLKVAQLLPQILDTPQDMEKFGFIPSQSGTAGTLHDPVKDHLGIGANLAIKVASEVLSRAIVYGRRHVGFANTTESHPVEFLANLMQIVADSIGMKFEPNFEMIYHAIYGSEPRRLVFSDLGGDNRADDDRPKTSLPGPAGDKVGDLLSDSIVNGRRVLAEAVEKAARRMIAKGRLGVMTANGELFDQSDTKKIINAIGSAVTAAELLGRARVQHHADLLNHHKDMYAEIPVLECFSTLPQFGTIGQALKYFHGLVPTLGVDPKRYGERMERHAFTLAVATEKTLLDRVKEALANYLGVNWWEGHPEGSPTGAAVVQQVLDDAGVSAKSPHYAEMVFRTNVLDAFHTGMDRQLDTPQMKERFPVWKYLGILDGRQGEDHEPKFDRFYPSVATFAQVRGPRAYNCRCSKSVLTAEQWKRLQEAGARLETSW